MRRCLEILGSAQTPYESRLHFVLAQLAFWLLAASDGHAKNFSLFINPGGRYTHTPLYDVLSAWPVIGKGAHHIPYEKVELAMALRSKSAHYKVARMEARHWQQLALETGGEAAWQAMQGTVEQVEPALGRVKGLLPANFPAHVWEAISAGLRRHADRFLHGRDRA